MNFTAPTVVTSLFDGRRTATLRRTLLIAVARSALHVNNASEPADCSLVEIRLLYHTPPPFGAPVGGDPVEFRKDFWRQKTRVPGLSCGVVCVVLSAAVLIQYRLVTDRQTHRHTTTANTALA